LGEGKGSGGSGIFSLSSAKVAAWNRRSISEINPKPIATICVWALAADTEEEALRQFKTRESSMIDRKQGIRLPLMPPEEAERPYSPAMSIAELHRKAIVGSSEPVAKENSIQLRVNGRVSAAAVYDRANRPTAANTG